MNKKLWKLWISLLFIIVFFGGCSFLGSISKKVHELPEEQEVIHKIDFSKETVNKREKNDMLKEQLLKFFKQYYSVDEQDILQLNVCPEKLDEEYRNEYTTFKSLELQLLKGFMSTELEESLQKQFLTTNIHFPRFIEINGSVIINYKGVEDVAYQIMERDKQKYTLLTDTIVNVEVVSKEKFNQVYYYDNKKKYYAKLNQQELDLEKDKDEIKVKCSYIIELEENEKGGISLFSLKENGGMSLPEENRRNIINHNFVQREYYLKQSMASDELLLKLFFHKFTNLGKDSYQYYQYAYDMNYDMFEQMMIDLDLDDYVSLDSEQYKSQFPKTIIPTKDDISYIDVEKEDIRIGVHINTSQKIRMYIIEFPAKVRLTDYSTCHMIFRYFAGVEDTVEGSKIKKIQYVFIAPQELLEEKIQSDKMNNHVEENRENL